MPPCIRYSFNFKWSINSFCIKQRAMDIGLLYNVSQKIHLLFFGNNSVKNHLISMIFDTQRPEEIDTRRL